MSRALFRPIESSEAQIQASVLRYLSMDHRVAWANRFNTGAHVIEEKGRRRFIRYAFPGCSDILGQLVDGRFLAVECKARLGRLTKTQRIFLETVNQFGGVAVTARSIIDVQTALNSAFKTKEVK